MEKLDSILNSLAYYKQSITTRQNMSNLLTIMLRWNLSKFHDNLVYLFPLYCRGSKKMEKEPSYSREIHIDTIKSVAGEARLDGAYCDYTEQEKFSFLQKLQSLGVRNIEMESTCFASMWNRAGVRGMKTSLASEANKPVICRTTTRQRFIYSSQ
ncbi:hypothetical protein AB6A40_009012 [Gnathostoma spinigerum]|uniref:Uncharacterized protein n=1 Tax=Gnathostoma spinigerum TaxID=75299 RepID=A0ABD6EYZ4_9BILA